MTQHEIQADLRALGLKAGDIVLLHSSLSSLGPVEGGADAVIDAFLGVLGASGTLVAPTFGDLGIITEALKNRPDAVRSIHPRASVAAVGGQAEAICRDHWKAETAHAEDTPYVRIADLGGYVCLLGVDQDRNTSLHTVEALLRLPYLKPTAEATFSTPEGEVSRSWPFFPGPHRDFIGLDRLLDERGLMRVGRIGPCVVRLIKSREMIDFLLEVGGLDPAFVLCDNPNCADCVRQRADLRRDRFARERFAVAASGRLAGRYVPEMVESCQAAGIDAVELDCIQGQPVQTVKPDRLAGAVSELRANGCEVTALRASAITETTEDFLQTAAACRVGRVVMPLDRDAGRYAKGAGALGVAVSFYNAHLGSAGVFELMADLRERGLEAGLVFSAANFARCGEKPFLTSYHHKLKRFTDQLDVEDCTTEGTPTHLAGGNAKIKELISILRCSSFEGHMVLGVGNRFVGNLSDAADRFVALLDAM